MKMIVGLGNPGQKYVGTRHNIGFEVLGSIAKQNLVSTPKSKFQAEYSEIRIGDEKVILLCPLTYMNLSGQSVSQAAAFFQIDPSEILVICDDFNLNAERIRFRPSGSSGGQNGINDIIKRLGTNEFPRLRIGIGPVPEKWNPADFVLGKFSSDDLVLMKPIVERCTKAADDWVRHGIGFCMNRYNQVSNQNSKQKQNTKETDSPDDKNRKADTEE